MTLTPGSCCDSSTHTVDDSYAATGGRKTTHGEVNGRPSPAPAWTSVLPLAVLSDHWGTPPR